MWIEAPSGSPEARACAVTPSRVCGLKRAADIRRPRAGGHTLAGVWIEARHEPQRCCGDVVTPSRVCGLKHKFHRDRRIKFSVTPSRVCGLKQQRKGTVGYRLCHTLAGVWIEASGPWGQRSEGHRHTLAGVWIEAIFQPGLSPKRLSHTLAGVWIEARSGTSEPLACPGHTLAGVWIEAKASRPSARRPRVTPSRVCGLKHIQRILSIIIWSHTLAGVWIEARCRRDDCTARWWPTHAGVGRGAFGHEALRSGGQSHPRGCVD